MRVYIGPYPDGNGEQEVNIQIDRYDCWAGDYTMAKIIHPFLLKIKEDKKSVPLVFDEDVPENLKRSPERDLVNDVEVDESWFARWEYVIDEMIWAFEQFIIPDYEAQYHSGVTDLIHVPIEGTEYLRLEHGPNHTHKVDEFGLKAHEDRMDNGIRLFGKYYRSLWT